MEEVQGYNAWILTMEYRFGSFMVHYLLRIHGCEWSNCQLRNSKFVGSVPLDTSEWDVFISGLASTRTSDPGASVRTVPAH